MTGHEHDSTGSKKLVVVGIGVVAVVYLAALAIHGPQRGTEMIVEAQSHAGHSESSGAQSGEAHAPGHSAALGETAHGGASEQPPSATAHEATGEHGGPGAAEGTAHGDAHAAPLVPPPLWTVIPFVALLLAIALFPLLPWTSHWWESNLHRFYVALALAVVTIAYYLLLHENPVEGHWPAHAIWPHSSAGLNWGSSGAVLANAILNEYIAFIVLLFSLYTISGGIRIQGDLRARPSTNAAILGIGGTMASFVGTTGAAMLLVRLLLETNRERKHVKHTVIFFIFIVCNCGGCLLPIGDPPLFLGYLRGVDFLWTFSLWPEWLLVNVALLAIYYVWDRFWFYPREQSRDLARDETEVRRLQLLGLWPNVPLLVGVVLGVALLDPSKTFPGTDWHPWLYLREVFQLGLVAFSLILGSDTVRRANGFNYHAIIEVAALFFGIFICMQPPLQILNIRGPELGLTQPWHFFWATGSLSAVLDNAPTYVVFFETAKALTAALGLSPTEAGVAISLLRAVSLGAVFMGAMTYIGNGPNFMVRAIAEQSGVKMPSFFGYMAYSCVLLLPLFSLCVWLMI